MDLYKPEIKAPWNKWFQIGIGGRWQAVPDRNTTYREWFFSPFYKFTYPGKTPVGRNDVPEGDIFGSIEVLETDPKQFKSLIWWLAAGIRILGLDVGVGIFIRTRKSMDKLLNRGVAKP